MSCTNLKAIDVAVFALLILTVSGCVQPADGGETQPSGYEGTSEFTADFDRCYTLRIGEDFRTQDFYNCMSDELKNAGKDPSKVQVCDDLDPDSFKAKCRAILLDDVELCDDFVVTSESTIYDPVAQKYSDAIDCIAQLAASSQNASICETYDFSKLERPASKAENYARDLCFVRVVQYGGSADLCEKVVGTGIKEFCRPEFGPS